MKKILFRFPLIHYLNPVNILGVVFMACVEYSRWQNMAQRISEYDQYNVKHSYTMFGLVPGTIVMIVWACFNILLYPYVFDAIIKLAARFFGSNILFRGFIRNTITIYQTELERGDIYTHHKVEYNSFGYPVGVVPQYDRAKPRAFGAASEYLILRISLTVIPVMLFILALWSGWMLSILIGWYFAWRFNHEKK